MSDSKKPSGKKAAPNAGKAGGSDIGAAAGNDADKGQGLVVTVIAKRLRAARKRLRNIEEIEAKRDGGKALNADQEDSLKAKPGVVAVIDELEKLISLLEKAAEEETEAAVSRAVGDALAVAKAEHEAAREADRAAAEAASAEAAAAAAEAAVAEATADTVSESDVHRLVELLYFSQTFGTQNGGVDERSLCLSFTQAAGGESAPLATADLEAIHALGRLITARPAEELVPHKDALGAAKALALQWVRGQGDDTFLPAAGCTVRELAAKLDRVLASDYASSVPSPPAPPPAPAPPAVPDAMLGPSAGAPAQKAQQHEAPMQPQMQPPPQQQQQPGGRHMVQGMLPGEVYAAPAMGVPRAPLHQSLQTPAGVPMVIPVQAPVADDAQQLLPPAGPDGLPEAHAQQPGMGARAYGYPQPPYPHHHHHYPMPPPVVAPPGPASVAAGGPAMHPPAANSGYALPESVPGYGFMAGDMLPPLPVVLDGAQEVVGAGEAVPVAAAASGGGRGGRGGRGYGSRGGGGSGGPGGPRGSSRGPRGGAAGASGGGYAPGQQGQGQGGYDARADGGRGGGGGRGGDGRGGAYQGGGQGGGRGGGGRRGGGRGGGGGRHSGSNQPVAVQ